MAESLNFSIGADTKGFTDGIGGMLGALAGLAAAFVSIQLVVEKFSEAIDMGGRLHDLSTRTGETAGNLAILERAFDNTSVGAEKVGPAITKMQVAISSASDSSSKAGKAFAELGISLSDLAGKSGIEQMKILADALAAIPNDADRARLAVEIFGKSGGDLIPILRNFSDEIDLAKRQLGSLPKIMDDSAAGFDSVGDSLNAIGQKATELAVGFLSTLLPAVEKVLDSLSTMDAAGFGQGLSEFLLGAFQSPLKVIELCAESMRFAAQTMGNELIAAFDYANQFLAAMFGATATSIEDLLDPFLTVLKFTSPTLAAALMGSLEGISGIADKIENAFAEAASHATYVRKDYLGAQESSERIKVITSEIREDGRNFANSMQESQDKTAQMLKDIRDFEPVQVTTFPTIANDQTGLLLPGDRNPNGNIPLSSAQSGTELLDSVIAEDKAKFGIDPEKEKIVSASQLQAQQNQMLSLIAGTSSTQAIGQSASARKAQDLQKELDTMAALGKADTAEFSAKQQSLQTNLDIAFGNTLTSADKDTAHQMAVEAYFKDSTQSMTELENQFEADILEQKRANDPAAAQEQRKKAEEAGAGGGAKDKPQSMMSLVQQLIGLVQKIEPKIPQHIMS